MDSLSRKMPKNSEPVDDWLLKEGYSRKITPKDSTCLFRVVSEQIYLTQHDHIRVRKECVDYMRKNPNIIEKNDLISVEDYLEQMACFTQWGGDNEIRAMSLLYKVDFVVFNAHKLIQSAVTNQGFKKSIYLCFTPPRQYDGVYSQEYMSNAAFCQSIVYQTLYKKVFNMSDIDNTIYKMLHDRSPEYRHEKFFLKGNIEIRDKLKMELLHKIDDACEENDENRSGNMRVTPFPYRVAKALDPQIFRNTDMDVWYELKKEVRNAGGWTKLNNDFQIGSKCLVQLDICPDKENNNILHSNDIKDDSKSSKASKKEDPVFYNGHIQEMSKNKGPVVVYIEELCEKKTVPYSSLKPLSPQKVKLNQNWNNMPKKNMTHDQNQKWKKCGARRTKDHGPNMNTSNFDRNHINGNRKEGHESKEWIEENSPKAEGLVTPDKFQMQNFNTCHNYDETMINTAPAENNHYPIIENSHHKISDEDDKKAVQNDKNRSLNVINQNHYVQANAGNNMYQPGPQYNNSENLPIIPTVQPINLSVSKSIDINGCDLPYAEPYTLRFFYNLGLEYFHANQMWNYPPNDQMITPAYFTSQNPPPISGPGNPSIMPSGVNNNEEMDQAGDMNRTKMHTMRRKDDGLDRNRNNLPKNNVQRNSERYHKSAQNVQQGQGHDPQKNMRDFNKGTPHNGTEKKEQQNMNKEVQRNNRNGLGSSYRKNDGRNNMHPQKQDHKHSNQNRFGNGFNKNNNENTQQSSEADQALPVQHTQYGGPPAYPMQFGQPPMYGQVAVCSSEAEAYAGYYPPQANFVPLSYSTMPADNGEPCFDNGYGPYPVFSPYPVYPQTPMYNASGVPDNWYSMAGASPTFVPYAPIVSPNPSNNTQNTSAV